VVVLALGAFLVAGTAQAHSEHGHAGQGQDRAGGQQAAMAQDQAGHQRAGMARDHSRHRAAADFRVRPARYQTPVVGLLETDGSVVRLDELLDGGRPVLMQFVFTTCTTICPIMSATFASAQSQLLDVHPDTLLVSISIDPEHDTPARMREYGERLGAGEQWHFLTGSAADIRRTMRAFDVLYAGDNKMYHQFNTFIRVPGREGWVRVDGSPSTAELVAEYRARLATP